MTMNCFVTFPTFKSKSRNSFSSNAQDGNIFCFFSLYFLKKKNGFSIVLNHCVTAIRNGNYTKEVEIKTE